jgi:hypothetical protein
MKMMPTEAATPQQLWQEINRAFTPFAGTSLYAIRAELFFHLQDAARRPWRMRLKNLCYSGALAWRAHPGARGRAMPSSGHIFVCDYAAEAGYGSLRPLLNSCRGEAVLVANAQVEAARAKEAAALPHLGLISADSGANRSRHRWQEYWRRSRRDYDALLGAASPGLQARLLSCSGLARALLRRAYGYEELYEDLLAKGRWQAVITHNDFTSLSYLAGEVARRRGVPDFTLQHGFPSLEYLPTSASFYLLWGKKFGDAMQARAAGNVTRFAISGAPRLDPLAFLPEARRMSSRAKFLALGLAAENQLNLLFLSQGQTPAFSERDRRHLDQLLRAIGAQPGVRLLVRPHPQERSSCARERGIALPAEISLIEALLAADAALSVSSTAMLEAALLGVPVLQFIPSPGCDPGFLHFPERAEDTAAALGTLARLQREAGRRQVVDAQASLVRECIANPGEATAAVWRQIAGCGPQPAARVAGR